MKKHLPKCLWMIFMYAITLSLSTESEAAPLSGSYTINPAQPATALNFHNIASAMSYLTGRNSRTDGGPANTAPFGISSNVTFTLAAGTYAEQLILEGSDIPGLSASSRLVFDGTDATATVLEFTGTTPVIQVKQCSYVTIRNIGVYNAAPAAPCGIFIYGAPTGAGNATGCEVKRCRVKLDNLTNGGTAIAVTDASNSQWMSNVGGDSISIDSNVCVGGYYGLTFYGSASALRNINIGIRHNQFSKTFAGVLISKINNGIDFLYNTVANDGQDGPTLTQYDAVKFVSCTNTGPAPTRVIGNKVYADTRGINIESCGNSISVPVQVYNNMIVARTAGLLINSPISAASYCQVYHNTIYASNPLYGPYLSSVPFTYLGRSSGQLSCMNNIFAVAASPDTTISLAAHIDVDTSLQAMNYNVYYNPSGGSGRMMWRKGRQHPASNILVKEIGGDSSVISEPSFVSATNLRLKHACQFRGTDLRAFVPYDIDSTLRPANPFAGCHEPGTETNDLMAEAITEPTFPLPQGTTASDLKVRIRNNGSFPVSSFSASYELNGTLTFTSWTGTLNPCDTVTVTFSGVNAMSFPDGIASLKVYTSWPNSIPDMAPENDTLSISLMSGTYVIGDTLSDYKTFEQALADLYARGLGGPVTFNVRPGTYPEQIYLNGPRIRNLSAVNTLTFDGSSADSTFITANRNQAATVVLHYCRYVTLRNLSIANTSPGQGVGVGIVGSTQSNAHNGTACHVKRCHITVNGASSTGINITDLVNGFNRNMVVRADSIELDSNRITGGSFGIMMEGTGDTSQNRGIFIRNNEFIDQAEKGMMLMRFSCGATIKGNRFTGTTSVSSLEITAFLSRNTGQLVIASNRFEAYTPQAIYFNASFSPNIALPTRIENNSITNALTGIYITQGAAATPPPNNMAVYHNSININRAGSNVGYGFYFSNASVASSVLTKNNILAVTSTSGQAIPVYFATTVNVGDLNHNLYYNRTGPGLLFRNGSITAANYRTLTGGGDQSFNDVPQWVSDTNLHITGGCKYKGISVGIATDLDNVTRNATPDLGCYEFISNALDLAVEALTEPSFPVVQGVQDVKALIRNNGTATVQSFVAVYEINGQPPVPMTVNHTLAPCDTVTITFQSLSILASNHIRIYTHSPNGLPDDYTQNDTLDQSVNATMEGVYTIGDTLSDFKTFTAAVNALNFHGISGPVTFNVRSGTYTEQVEVSGNILGVSDTATVTFQSQAAHPDSVILQFNSGPNTNFVFRFNYASYFTLRNISVVALNATYARVIDITGNASSDTVEGCRIVSATGGGDKAGIYAATFTGTGNVIRNNYIDNGVYGIYWYGVSATNFNNNTLIEGNHISNAGTSSIAANYASNLRVVNNTARSSADYHRALAFTYLLGHFDISGNHLTLTNATHAIWINLSNTPVSRKRLIAGNVIVMSGNASTGLNGLYFAQSSNTLIAHNSIHITGGSPHSSYALYLNAPNAVSAGNDVFNNIFANSGGGCAMFYQATAAAINNRLDHNLLYTTGASLAERPAAYPNPAKVASLAAWRTATGRDLNSISYKPAFVNDTILVPDAAHPGVWAMNGRAVHIDSTYHHTKHDKSGNLRVSLAANGVPDLGAFEVTPLSIPPDATAIGVTQHDSTQVFLFGSDTVARIKWPASGILPASVTVKQYPGQKPPQIDTASVYMYFHTSISAAQGTYDAAQVEVFYKEPWLGTVTRKADLRLAAKPAAGSWNQLFITTSNPADTMRMILSHSASSLYGSFTGADITAPLPVKLIAFSGKAQQNDAQLSWVTAQEKNSARFYVERSYDNNTWQQAGTVKAAGNSATVQTYAFTDKLVFASAPAAYYRLKMADADGSFAYSQTIRIEAGTANENAVTVYPNPFHNELLVLTTEQTEAPSVMLYSITGEALPCPVSTGNGPTIIDTQHLKPGFYFLEIKTNGTTQLKKLVKE